MKTIFSLASLLTFLTVTHSLLFAQSPPVQVGKVLVKVLTGTGAAEALRRSGMAFESYQKESSIYDQLKEKGLDCRQDAIYSVFFRTTGGYWSDWLSKPDVFFCVDIEGKGTYLVPKIWTNYRGEPILDRVLSDHLLPGTRVVVRVMDDDTSSDTIWNSILKTRWSLSLRSMPAFTRFIPVKLNLAGQLQLLDRTVVIDAPDYIASATFYVPNTEDGVWVADGTLVDSQNQNVGDIKFASVWSSQKDLQQQEAKVSSALGTTIFWSVIGGCLLLWFCSSFFRSSRSKVEGLPINEDRSVKP